MPHASQVFQEMCINQRFYIFGEQSLDKNSFIESRSDFWRDFYLLHGMWLAGVVTLKKIFATMCLEFAD